MEHERISTLLSRTPAGLPPVEPDYPRFLRRAGRRRGRRIAVASVVAAVAAVGLIVPLVQLAGIGGSHGSRNPAASGGAAVSATTNPAATSAPDVGSFSCNDSGTEVVTPEFAVQADGVHLHVDNPGGAAALILRTPDATKSYPVDLTGSNFTDETTPYLVPGRYEAACTDDAAGQAGTAGSAADWVPVTISDAAGLWTSPAIDCSDPRERMVLTGQVIDGREIVPSVIRSGVNGIQPSDDIVPAAYPQSEEHIQYLVERDGARVALVTFLARDLPTHDAGLDVTSCDSSGIGEGQGIR